MSKFVKERNYDHLIHLSISKIAPMITCPYTMCKYHTKSCTDCVIDWLQAPYDEFERNSERMK